MGRCIVARGWLSVMIALTGSGSAHAQGGVEQRAEPNVELSELSYEVALSEAISAHDRGDFDRARAFMERAHELEPSARTLRGLGIVAFSEGRHREAIDHLEAALASTDKPLPPDLQDNVRELLSHAWGQVGRYQVGVDPPVGDFLVDGSAPELRGDGTLILEPGNHLLTVRAPERAPYELPLVVRPGEQRSLHVVLALAAPSTTEPSKEPDPPASVPMAACERPVFYTPRVRRVAFGVGAGLVGVGAGLWTLAYLRLQDLVAECEQREGGGCTERAAVGLYRGDNIQGLRISAGALMGAGAALLFTAASMELWRARGSRPSGQLVLGLGSLGWLGQF